MSCSTGKKTFPSWTDANKAAKQHLRRFSVTERPYRCLECQEWHLTTQRKTDTRPYQRSKEKQKWRADF